MATRLTLGVFLAMLLGSTMAVRAAEQEPKLKAGDPAPKLDVAKWVKGDPVKELEKDRIYVVEFWATWCPPCRASIPHMTQLQKKYADKGVTMIGQNLGEGEKKVEPFVTQMGDKMDYRVAIDKDGAMGKTWFKAAGQAGIPCAFIVDKAGMIAWIGHPMTMDKVLEQVVAGTYDPGKPAARPGKPNGGAANKGN
ncbi:MAG: TlpA disulfide reductase family protein [Tepidisphaeraceae bacterium]